MPLVVHTHPGTVPQVVEPYELQLAPTEDTQRSCVELQVQPGALMQLVDVYNPQLLVPMEEEAQ